MSLHSPERAHFRCGGEIIENSMFKHMQLHHQDQQPQFVFKAEKFFKDVCSDQIFEGVCINNSPSTHGYLMNSRAGPHPSLNDHHLAQQHQLQQRLLTSYKQLEMPLPYWPQEQQAIWCGEFQWPCLFKGLGSIKLPLVGLWAEEEVQTSIWRDPGARRREDAREDLEDPNLFFKHPSQEHLSLVI